MAGLYAFVGMVFGALAGTLPFANPRPYWKKFLVNAPSLMAVAGLMGLANYCIENIAEPTDLARMITVTAGLFAAKLVHSVAKTMDP